MMTKPRWGTGGGVQTQGSSLREQPWALRRNSVGVEYIDNSDQCQISSYQVLRTVENIGVAVAAPHMEIPILACKNASQRCPLGLLRNILSVIQIGQRDCGHAEVRGNYDFSGVTLRFR